MWVISTAIRDITRNCKIPNPRYKSNHRFFKMTVFHTLVFNISEVNQSTIPVDLPIVGDPDVDVILSTVFPKGPTLFQLDGKRLQLLQPLDRDADNLSHMVFQVRNAILSLYKSIDTQMSLGNLIYVLPLT